MSEKRPMSEIRWVLAWAIGIALLASAPYLVGVAIAPPGYHFLGFTHNTDDAAVYLSWMRQAADGHFFIRNLFTNEPGVARMFNLLFFAMGFKAGVLHIPLAWMFHLTRIVFAIALMLMVWQFSKLFLDDPAQRKLLIPLVGLSSGIGWLMPGAKTPIGPVDRWQPEAITFLSIYLNPLFLAGMLLMLGSFYFLALAERTGRPRYAIHAGLCLLVLGNVHTYDVLTVAVVWTCYVAAKACLERRIPTRMIALSVLAAVIAAPSVAYQFWLYQVDPVFRARANTATESPVIWSFFAGYGLVLVGAITGTVISTRSPAARAVVRARFPIAPERNPLLFPIVWSVVGFVLPYAPVAQQRKLVMGLHFPLCILCAYALSRLLAAMSRERAMLLAAALLIVLFASNLAFMREDMAFLTQGRTAPIFPAFASDQELSAMRWLRENAGPRDTVLGPPSFSLFVPGIAGRQVYYGHWSETPDYGSKLNEWADFEQYEETRGELINNSRADYVVIEGDRDYLADTYLARGTLVRVFDSPGSPGVFVYKVTR